MGAGTLSRDASVAALDRGGSSFATFFLFFGVDLMKAGAILRYGFGLLAAAASAGALANPKPWQLNMTEGVTETASRVHSLHMLILWICIVIGVIVFGAMTVAMIKFRKSKGAVPAKWSHNTLAEVLWTVIPVLIRFGNPQATIALTNPRLKLRGPELSEPQLVVDLVRAGDRSVYGDLEVFHVKPDGSRESIYVSRGLAVYCPLEVRTKTIRMKGVDPAGLTTGSLLVRFEETPDMHGDQVAELVVPLTTETASLR